MSDYPDLEEEYELMYADDIELLNERNDNEPTAVKKKTLPAKRSLDFSSTDTENSTKTKLNSKAISNLSAKEKDDILSLSPALQPLETTQTSVSYKRTAEELFGDINDIDFENYELPSKKQKTEEENDLDLINKIIEGRKMRQILAEPSRIQSDAKPFYDPKDNISFNIPRWAFVPLTNSDGDRFYIRLESEETWDTSLDTSEKLSLKSMYASAWDEARKILEDKQQREIEQQSLQEEPLPESDIVVSCDMWVDKYRPNSYVELLSEEPVNRALLHWLHLWDKVVFKKEVKTKDPQQRNSFSKRTGQFQLTNKWKGKREAEPEMDEDGRPHHKVALLCGPPGVGKTTLAHLLAKLAGYRPVELNASDERSTDAFRTALQSATLMRSVIDAERRPNCLILDEIDGAPIQTVELLVKWCTATVTKKEDGGKKRAKSQPLRRPVIAICNDLYATSLRPLRGVALVVWVGAAGSARLTARLGAVASRERLRAGARALAALAARAAGDVRAALHVLAFLKATSKAQINVEDVENAAIGNKDCTRSFMQALQAVFTLTDRQNDILKVVHAAGEYDRIVDGIFENYLSARVDARLLIACDTTSWLRLYDTIHAWVLRNQNYSVYGALPYCIVRCHQLLASRAPQKIKFPMQAQEIVRKKAELDSILHSVWQGSTPAVVTTRDTLRLDVLPLLPYLLAPTLRSANVQLCSEAERKSLRVCAGAMCDYGLQYVQQRTADGLYPFVLEPDIYKMAFFGSEERVRPSPPIRQAIAREQQLEIIRRNEEMAAKVPSKPKRGDILKPSINKNGEAKQIAAKETRLPNHLQRLKPKAVEKTTSQVHKDFFGRIVPLAQMQKQDAVADVISSSNIFYQYREGFNNAVRRNVRMKDLM